MTSVYLTLPCTYSYLAFRCKAPRRSTVT